MNISTANISVPDEVGATQVAEDSRLDRLIARSQDVKSRTESFEQSPEGWFDPDSLAITKLPAERHPIRQMVARSTMRDSLKTAANRRVLVVYRILNSVAHTMHDFNVALAFPWHQITVEQVFGYTDRLAKSELKPASVALYTSTLRSLLGACRQVGLIDHTRLAVLLDQLIAPVVPVQDAGRAISPAEIVALFAAAENRNPWRQARTRTILAVFTTTGMRRCELVDLTMQDWDRKNLTLNISQGKRNNPRVVPLHPDADAYIADWVTKRGDHDGPLFTATKTSPSKRIEGRSVNALLSTLAEKAGIEPISCHDFRRTVVTTLLRTTDAAIVARLVGHKSLETTFRYDKTPLNLQRHAVGSLTVPDFATPNDTDGEVA